MRKIVFILILLFSSILISGCKIESFDEKNAINLLNEYYSSEDVEIKEYYGKYKNAYVVLVKTTKISTMYRKDTINNIEFYYEGNAQLLEIKNNKVYSLKEAFLNLIIDSNNLRELKKAYEEEYVHKDYILYTEIGEEIILETKKIYEEKRDKISVDNEVIVDIDRNFFNYRFSSADFDMIDVISVRCEDERYLDIPVEVWENVGFRLSYIIVISNRGIDNVIKTIRILEQLDFVISAGHNTDIHLWV